MIIKYQRIEDRPVNYINLVLSVEDGCNPEDGEYKLIITNFLGYLDINQIGGLDDITLIKEAIDNEDLEYPKNGELQIVLKESGELDGFFWNKYYVVDRVCKIEY